jgi:transaldolase
MSESIRSLIDSGTKLYLDSIDPDLLRQNLAWGAVGATSNPIIICDLIAKGLCDSLLSEQLHQGRNDDEIAWLLTNHLVEQAQQQLMPVWEATDGNDGWVSFELDPLIEDTELGLTHSDRVDRYVDEGLRWSNGRINRMIKVPATPAGLEALEPLAAAGITLNVTLIFTPAQYLAARAAIWAGAQQRGSTDPFKSVYSIFVSRVDQYTLEHTPQLSSAAQGQVGIVNAKRIWLENQRFWKEHPTRLSQEIIFASTGTKSPSDPAWKYVEALAGSDIQTNPPATNQAVDESGRRFSKRVDRLPADEVLAEIDSVIDLDHMQQVLVSEGVSKFTAPQHKLLQLIGSKRQDLVGNA